MADELVRTLNLSIDEQQRLGALTGRIKSVADFLKDAVEAVKDTDFPRQLAQVAPWWFGAMGEAVAKTVPPVRFVAEFLKAATEVRDPERLAYIACTAAYQRATELAFAAIGPPSGPRLDTAWQPKVRKKADAHEGLALKELSFRTLWSNPFFAESEELVVSAATQVGYDETERRRLVVEIRMRVPGELKRLLSHPDTRERFIPLADWLRFDNIEERVHDAWQTHADYQRRLFEESPVFGEERFSLSDVYVDTECGVLSWEQIVGDREGPGADARTVHHGGDAKTGLLDAFDEANGGRHDLIASVLALMGDPSFRDAIVVQGPAGSGKSTFTLRLAVELLRQGLRPIRVRLRDMGHSMRNIEDAIPEAVRFWDDGERPGHVPPARPEELFLNNALFDQTIEFGSATICPYVLILDGWDEVSVSAQRGFFEQIEHLLGQVRDRFLNRGHRSTIRVVVTGRPSDAVARSSFLKKSTRVLTIRPLSPPALRLQVTRLRHALDGATDTTEGLTPLAPILDRYAEGFSTEEWEGRTVFVPRRGAALDVLGLPLLAHLAVRLVSEWQDGDVTDIVGNSTTLFRLLTDHTCESARYGPDVPESPLRPKRLRKLLQQTASAMTAYGQDSIPYDELEQRLENLDQPLIEEVRQVAGASPISALVISFFFKGGHKELGAEFTHKAFREYLAAEAIVEALKAYGKKAPDSLAERVDYWRDFTPSDPRYDFSRTLGRLIGVQWLTAEVAEHLGPLIEWELARARRPEAVVPRRHPTESLSVDGWRRVRDGLADLWDWWGAGVHLRPQPKMKGRQLERLERPYVEELIEWQIHQHRELGYEPWPSRSTSVDGKLGDALCRLTSWVHHHVAVAREEELRSRDCSQTPPDGQAKARRFQRAGIVAGRRELRFAPSGDNQLFWSSYCHRINAARTRPHGPFPGGVSLRGVWLVGAKLSGLDCDDTDLSGADLSLADMTHCRFVFSQFTFASLREATVDNTEWIGCDLTGAVLSGTRGGWQRWEGCTLNHASADRSYFASSTLLQVSFDRASVREAVLSGCRLELCGFTGADLTGASFRKSTLDNVTVDNDEPLKLDASGFAASGQSAERQDDNAT